ncbi:MAG TPA: Wzz/FepE/Etk N-terminal domain-containing protein [Solirubrobacteraceae bacterium]|nr:Wzz/FepE/Etk N-terminal domain-containing protein [Solirubrobacteraceae bacterium]
MNDTTDATAIFAPLWRRKWVILAVGIVVGVASYFYYKREQPTYASSTQIFLGASAEEQAPGEKTSTKLQSASVTDQVAVINSIIAERVHQQLVREGKAALARTAKIRARNPEKSEFIVISVEGPHTSAGPALVANLTAQTYISRVRSSHKRVVERAIAIARSQLRRVEAAGAPQTSAGSKEKRAGSTSPSPVTVLRATTLSTKINELESTLGATGAIQVKPANPATAKLLGPQPRKDAIFGFALGILLAAIAAYVLSRSDRRLRSLAGIEAAFQLPILTALPKVGRPVVVRDGRPIPSRVLLEPLRTLHAALRLGDSADGATNTARRVILAISPDAGDGKSSLIADLALVQRDAGLRVAIVEANFRRPVQARLLGSDQPQGLAEVLAGSVPIEEALMPVRPAEPAAPAPPSGAVLTAVGARAGSLSLLAGGGEVANPPALMAHEAFPGILGALAAEFDYVLIDAPSPLEFSDVLPLLGGVDGLIILARVGHTREVAVRRLMDLLLRTPSAPVLGVVANCVAPRDSERYGFATSTGSVWQRKPIGR